MPRLMPPAPLEGGAGSEGFLAGVDASIIAFFLGGVTVLLALLVRLRGISVRHLLSAEKGQGVKERETHF